MDRELSNFMKANRREVNNGKYSVRFGLLRAMILPRSFQVVVSSQFGEARPCEPLVWRTQVPFVGHLNQIMITICFVYKKHVPVLPGRAAKRRRPWQIIWCSGGSFHRSASGGQRLTGRVSGEQCGRIDKEIFAAPL